MSQTQALQIKSRKFCDYRWSLVVSFSIWLSTERVLMRWGESKGGFIWHDFCLWLSCLTSIHHDFRPSIHAQFSLTASWNIAGNVVKMTNNRIVWSLVVLCWIFINLKSWLKDEESQKADLDGMIFAYDYLAWLANIMTFDHPYVHSFL